MEVQVVGTTPGEFSDRFLLSTYVVNGEIAVDAGSIGLGLSPEEQRAIHTIIITHTHIDHIASLPLFVVENNGAREHPPVVHSTAHNLAMLHKHLFNNVFWPDLQSISEDFFVTRAVEPHCTVAAKRYEFHLFPVNHPVPTCGVVLRDTSSHEEVIFSSDTSLCDALWMEANRLPHLKGIFVEVSFPDSLKDLALSTGHLTPSLLAGELKKLRRKAPLLITHFKAQYFRQIQEELARIEGINFRMCHAGERFCLE